jgi:hypothetical protein
MSSYGALYIADYPVFSSRNYVLPDVMTLFRENDKRIYERKVSDRNPIEWGHIESGEGEIETAVEYHTPIKHVLQRLEVMGFTLRRVKKEFEAEKAAELNKIKEWSEDDDHNLWSDDIEVLETNTFDNYLEAFQSILASMVNTVHYLEKFPDASKLIKYILKDGGEFHWGFPCLDIRCFIRALLEVAPNESIMVQDITELVNAGYYDQKDDVCELAFQELNKDYPINSKIIVLTEGLTDIEVLEPSLKLLYPHLYEYYSFMDFGVHMPGGVGSLINAVKSFAGAGIKNRIVALFDNDTAAFSAVDTLKNIKIPRNIVIRHYPDIELARSYPALGPSGLIHQDINSLACSVELYFGNDVLEINGHLTPIQWKGYDERLGRYQGEIMHKSELKDRFLEKLSRCQSDPIAINGADWNGVNSILMHIFEAFNI